MQSSHNVSTLTKISSEIIYQNPLGYLNNAIRVIFSPSIEVVDGVLFGLLFDDSRYVVYIVESNFSVLVFFNTTADAINAYKKTNGTSFSCGDVIVDVTCQLLYPTLDPVFTITLKAKTDLERRSFNGKVYICKTEKQVITSMRKLLGKKAIDVTEEEKVILGVKVTTEEVDSIRSGNKIGLIQVASEDICILYRIDFLCVDSPQLPNELVDLLQNPFISKVSIGAELYSKRLNQQFGIKTKGFVPYDTIPLFYRCKPNNLSSLCAIFLGFQPRQSGTIITTWLKKTILPTEFLRSAATSAWIYREVYLKLVEANELHALSHESFDFR
jgi:hypothetical protein